MPCLLSFAHHMFFFFFFFFFSKLLGFSDTGEVNTGEVKCRNAHLSHYIWYCYAYVVTINTVAPYVFEQ